MNASYEPHRLVIQHLAVLESAPPIATKVEEEVFGAIDKKIEAWTEARGEKWEGAFQYFFEDGEISFKPESWPNNDEGMYLTHYSLDRETLPDAPTYYLSSLLGQAKARMGFFLYVDATWMTGSARSNGKWKAYLDAQFKQTSLKKAGYELDADGRLFLPISDIDAQLLASDYPSSIDEALAPIDTALAKLEAAHDEIDALLKRAQVLLNPNAGMTTL